MQLGPCVRSFVRSCVACAVARSPSCCAGYSIILLLLLLLLLLLVFVLVLLLLLLLSSLLLLCFLCALYAVGDPSCSSLMESLGYQMPFTQVPVALPLVAAPGNMRSLVSMDG